MHYAGCRSDHGQSLAFLSATGPGYWGAFLVMLKGLGPGGALREYPAARKGSGDVQPVVLHVAPDVARTLLLK